MDLLCISLEVCMSDEEIKECIRNMIPVCIEKKQGFCLTIDGFCKDERDLWNIPEAVVFMKRLCKLGFISVLEVSTTCPALMKKEYENITEKLPGFGALEVWMCATNRMESGKNEMDKATIEIFLDHLNDSNIRAEKVFKENSIENVKTTQIPDAPIKHSGFNKRLRG